MRSTPAYFLCFAIGEYKQDLRKGREGVDSTTRSIRREHAASKDEVPTPPRLSCSKKGVGGKRDDSFVILKKNIKGLMSRSEI